jgi:predicted  nucleic acid-binding Zn-ribbon protein
MRMYSKAASADNNDDDPSRYISMQNVSVITKIQQDIDSSSKKMEELESAQTAIIAQVSQLPDVVEDTRMLVETVKSNLEKMKQLENHTAAMDAKIIAEQEASKQLQEDVSRNQAAVSREIENIDRELSVLQLCRRNIG